MIKALALVALLALVGACSDGEDEEHVLTREELMKPETCKECHPKHYREWSSSMHAYAAKDPVFVAMNKRGQREAKLGNFCVNCHAPMAVREGATKDGLNLDKVPDHLQGVTCYFCHNAIGVDNDHGNRDHNNTVRLANDTTMRGSIPNPVDPKVHHAEYSEFHDRYKGKSSQLCGGCHDIVTPDHGVHLERTFDEYKHSALSNDKNDGFLACQNCHMNEAGVGFAAEKVKGVGYRTLHDHLWPAVDVPLTDFPHREALRSAVEDCELPGTSISYAALESTGEGRYTLTLETGAAHAQPSGAAHDRRMWLEMTVYDGDGKVSYQNSKVADDALEMPPAKEGEPWAFHDQIFDADGKPVHMFWDAAKSKDYPDGYYSRALPAPTARVDDPHWATREFDTGTPFPSKIEVKLRISPIGRDVLQDLVDSKDLDADILDEMPTFTAYSARFDFLPGIAVPSDAVVTRIKDCKRYKCLYDPKSDACDDAAPPRSAGAPPLTD